MSVAERLKNWRVAWILTSKRGLCDSAQRALTEQPEATPQVSSPSPQFALKGRHKIDLLNPIQGALRDGTLTYGGVHPRSWILLPQADVYEAFRLNRNRDDVD